MGLFDDLKNGIQNNLPNIVPDIFKEKAKEFYWDAHNSLREKTVNVDDSVREIGYSIYSVLRDGLNSKESGDNKNAKSSFQKTINAEEDFDYKKYYYNENGEVIYFRTTKSAACMMSAELALEQDNLNNAENFIQKALQIDPDNQHALKLLLRINQQQGLSESDPEESYNKENVVPNRLDPPHSIPLPQVTILGKERLFHDFKHDHGIVTNSDLMTDVFLQVKLLSRSSVKILIAGETGTGKELIARSIHKESKRKGKFIAINAAAFTDDLFESELFGHVTGAFTGAVRDKIGLMKEADNGTLFIDEIADFSQRVQPILLRALQEQEFYPVGSKELMKVNVRFISATNKELKPLIEKGEFREDLFYRIAGTIIRLPTLDEKPEDIPSLALHFFSKYLDKQEKGGDFIPKLNDIDILTTSKWPGNIRQLESYMERFVAIFQNGDDHSRSQFRNLLKWPPDESNETKTVEYPSEDTKDLLEESLSEALRSYLKFHKNQSKAASELGIAVLTLMRRIRTCYIIFAIEYGEAAVENLLKYAPQDASKEKDTVSDYVSRIRQCIKFAKKSEKDRQKEVNKPYLIKYHEQVLKLIEVFE